MTHKKLSEILDLELAWRRVKRDQYNDIIPDILDLRDVDYDKENTINNLRKRVDMDYEPSSPLEIDVPKKGYTLRLGSNLIPEDRIVYQAVVDFISSKVEEPPAECTFSYRLNKNSKSNDMFQFWRPWWLKMRKKMREVYTGDYCYLLRTDIAAYFEHIDHSILRTNILNGQIEDKQVLDLLNKLMKRWAVSDAKHIGIPQGCDASSCIGNLYLINLDKTMKRGDFKYFRYSDDIYVLTRDEKEARMAIKVITRELRRLHLNLQEAKTEIITDQKRVAEETGSEEEDRIRDFDYEFQRKLRKNDVEESENEIVRKYNEITRNSRAKKVDTSTFRWCVNRLCKLRSDKAVKFILIRLGEMPFLADLFFEYIQIFVNRTFVRERIVNFLTSRNNIYEWQEMWLLLTLSKANKLDNVQLDVVRKIIRDSSKHWASKVAAILVLGKLGDDADRNWLRGLYSSESNNCIKRAIAVGVHGLPRSVRNGFYASIENDSYDMRRLVKYLRQEKIETI